MSGTSANWPALDLTGWAGTKSALHHYAQMLGKLSLALAPDQPNWLFTSLALTMRGFTTRPIPYGDAAVQGSLDVFSSELVVEVSDGRRATIALVPARPVASVYADLCAALASLGVDVVLTTVPQEIADTMPFDVDRRPAEYDPSAVQRWFTAMTAIAGVFDRWRAFFFGRTGIQLWWGAFDLAVLLFSGKHVPPPTDRGYLLRYDLDAEMMNVGIYLGDDTAPAAFFYGYIYPHPAGCETRPIMPAGATWSAQLGEWVLPYDAVRTAADPGATLRMFLDAIYERCSTDAGWDRQALSYQHPPRARHGSPLTRQRP
jgi:hypothetical protein